MKLSNLKFVRYAQFTSCFLIILIVFGACARKPVMVKESANDEGEEVAIQKKKPLQIPEDRLIDILHTELELSFDLQKQMVIGTATITLRPFRDNITGFHLDAKSMEIKNIEILTGEAPRIKHNYNGRKIVFTSDSILGKKDLLTVRIDYSTIPSNYTDSLSPENKGLFFIDPMDTIPGIEPQIWTQGESEFNSIWFPTNDRPDEKFTQEIFISVDTGLVTLSNGQLIARTFNNDGTRTDYWKQDQPHSAYLTMIAVGSWEVLEIPSETTPLYIYTEKEYNPDILKVFRHTPEMIDFYAGLFDYPFPWDKYAQIPVRNFVTGAMENTSASVFMENLYVDEKYLVDENFDWIISHELIHQWFGDLVTAESWSYISLNEAIANYGEYLWAEYKYGEEEAALVRLAELDEYFAEAKKYRAPIIRFRYNHPDEMFDAHSYSKGGLVLHMLRKELGDELFFKSLGIYLKRFRYQSVELSDLRKVFEEVSGKDLRLFFMQWFEKPGHPEIVIKYTEKPDSVLSIQIEQVQKTGEMIFPLNLSYLYNRDVILDTTLFIDEKNESFEWKVKGFNGTLIPDPDHRLLADLSLKKSFEKLLLQYRESQDFLNRYDAFQILLDSFPDKIKNTGLAQEFLNDKSYTIHELTLNFIERNYELLGGDTERKVKELAVKSDKSYVRGAALSALLSLSDTDTSFYRPFLQDSSWYVNAIALDALVYLKKDSQDLNEIIREFESSNNPHVVSIVASYFASSEEDHSDWFIEKAIRLNDQDKYAILGYYGLGLRNADSLTRNRGIEYLYHIAISDEYTFNRVMAYQSLLVFVDDPDVKKKLLAILNREDADAIKDWFSSLLDQG